MKAKLTFRLLNQYLVPVAAGILADFKLDLVFIKYNKKRLKFS